MEKDASESELRRPSKEEEEKTARRTAEALGMTVADKIAASQPKSVASGKPAEPVFVRYTPNQQSAEHNSGATQRVIRLQEAPVDPLEPPRHKHKKLPGGPPSPPPPVMHSPPRKITVADQQSWKIPPVISGWKNSKGYTVPLDKRLAADGRGLVVNTVNDKFASLSESLFLAERTAREEIEQRAKLAKQIAQKDKERKEEEMRMLAARYRKQAAAVGEEERQTEDYAEAVKEASVEAQEERDELRRERQRDIKRDMRMEHRGKETKKSQEAEQRRSERDRERDVSEKIALGQKVGVSQDSLYDQRLFNQSAGMSSGFGQEDSYDLYDKPLFNGSTSAHLYKATKGNDELNNEGDGEAEARNLIEKSTSRFKADRGFKGTEGSAESRAAPVQFEREEADPFNQGALMAEARQRKDDRDDKGRGSKRGNDDDDDRADKRRRY
jgi:SNW domain-containing protein 1